MIHYLRMDHLIIDCGGYVISPSFEDLYTFLIIIIILIVGSIDGTTKA